MFTKLFALLALFSSTAHAAYFPTFEQLIGLQISTPANPSANYNKLYVKSDDKLYILTSAGVETLVGPSAAGGDVSSNTATSVDSEIALFNGTTGKSIKRATGTGFAKVTSGVLSAQAQIAIGSDVSGLGANVATFLGTPSSANLASALTDETGSGAAVFATSPTLVTPALGTPTALVGTNITGTAAALSIGGNAATSTALAANPTDCAANNFAYQIDASGNLTCSAIALADLPVLTGYSIGTTVGTVSSSDSILQAIQKLAGNQRLAEFDDGNSGTSDTLDFANGPAHKSTLTGNVTYTFSNPIAGQAYVIKIVQGASSYTVTWPAAVKWSAGTAPTITTTNGKIDIVNLYYDGTNYYGSYSQNY
jgi:hypothetical protein